MARRHKAEKKDLIPDPKYNNELVARLINYIMERGKKNVAEVIVYGAMDRISKKLEQDPVEIMIKAVENMKPRVEVKSKRVGGATYQVPVDIGRSRQLALALRWLVQYSRGRHGIGMQEALAAEILDAYNNQGNVVKKRDETHKMAQANKAFAHYAW